MTGRKGRAALVSRGGEGGVNWRNHRGVIRRVEYFPTLLRRNKTAQPAPGGPLCTEPPPSWPIHSPRMALSPDRNRKTHEGLELLHRVFMRMSPEAPLGGAPG